MKRMIALCLAAFAAMTVPIRADDASPVIPADASGHLTLRYFDDSDETRPITGAEFQILQVAEIGTDFDSNGSYIPLVDGIDFREETDAAAYEEKVLEAYETDPKLGYTAYSTVGEDGTAEFDGIPAGAYLVRNSKTVRYHITSSAFLVSIPETDETSTYWNFDVTADPKPNLAGDLQVTKTLEGAGADEDDVFSFRFTIAEGEYRALMPDGLERTIHTGDVIQIQGGQSITVYDLPEHSQYEVVELEANENGYRTLYRNTEGVISYAEETEAEIINSNTVSTGVTTRDVAIMLSVAGGLLALLLLLILIRRREKQNEEK